MDLVKIYIVLLYYIFGMAASTTTHCGSELVFLVFVLIRSPQI